MSDELKPCPFCGEAAATAGKKATRFPWFKKVACSNDGCGAHFAYWHPDEWNRRADRRAQPAEAEGPGDWEWLKLTAEVAEEDGPWEPRLGMTDCETAFSQSASPTKVLELIDALSAVTAERDRLRDDAERYAHLKAAWDDDVLISYLDSNVHPSDWDSVIDAAMAAKEA